jgi:integrase
VSGNIAKRPNGKWRARYRDDLGKEHAAHFDKKPAAQRWLDEQTTARVTGTQIDPAAGKVSFKSFYEDWSMRQLWQANTAETMALAVRTFPYADLPLRAIRRSHIESWVKSMSTAGLMPATVGTRFRCVARIFRGAVDDRLISHDPTKGVKLPALRRREATMAIPTPEQVGRLLAAADEDFAPLVALCAFAGLRLAEASSVQVGDIDFLRRTLRITRQVQRAGAGTGPEIRAPKYNSERTVYLPDGLLVILSGQIARRGIAGQPDAWLFVGKTALRR